MRERDLDLIAGLVEGRLEDETEARALIASGPEFQSEYEAQKLAYDTLSNVSPATLTEAERSTLHRDLWTELRSEGATTTTRARNPWYYRWAPVAAGMFVVVGLVAVINQGGGDDAGIEAATATTAVADAADESAGSGGDTAEPAPMDGGSVDVAELLSQDFARALSDTDVAYYEAEAEKVRSGDLEGAQSFDEETAQSGRIQACLETANLEGFRAIGASSATTEDGDGESEVPEGVSPYIAAIQEGSNPEDAPIAFVDLFTCDLIYVDQ